MQRDIKVGSSDLLIPLIANEQVERRKHPLGMRPSTEEEECYGLHKDEFITRASLQAV